MFGMIRSNFARQLVRNFSGSPSYFATATAGNPEIQKNIKDIVDQNKIVVFMKGDKTRPMCGFSNAVVQVFRMHGVDEFKDVNVLDNEEVRQGVKDFTKWPTIPQVFVQGEFIGGCDILIQMHRSGELVDVLKKAGIESQIPPPPEGSSEEGNEEKK